MEGSALGLLEMKEGSLLGSPLEMKEGSFEVPIDGSTVGTDIDGAVVPVSASTKWLSYL